MKKSDTQKSESSVQPAASRFGGSIVYRYDPNPGVAYINATNLCTNRCAFCVKQFTSGLSGYDLYLEREPTTDELWEELQREIQAADSEVVWCGFGEPTTKLDLVLEVTRRIKERYPHIQVRLDTDGQAQLRYRSRSVVKELKEAGVDSVSISLNAENEEKYNLLCNPLYPDAYNAVIQFARDCAKHFPKVRLSVVGGTDVDILKCRKIAEEMNCRFIVRG